MLMPSLKVALKTVIFFLGSETGESLLSFFITSCHSDDQSSHFTFLNLNTNVGTANQDAFDCSIEVKSNKVVKQAESIFIFLVEPRCDLSFAEVKFCML